MSNAPDHNPHSDTSRDAAIYNLPHRDTDRARALAALTEAGEHGLTDFELETATGIKQTSIGKRRGELVRAGLVARRLVIDPDTLQLIGDRRRAPSGAWSAVWCLAHYSQPEQLT